MENPNCGACGRFLNCDEGMSHFTPDSEHTIESMEWYCRDCSEREQNQTRLAAPTGDPRHRLTHGSAAPGGEHA